MELKRAELQALRTAVSDGPSLDEMLRRRFPHATISVIRGFDRFSSEAYTRGAYFSASAAAAAMAKIPPNGSPGLADTYHLLTGEVGQFRSLVDQNTRQPLDRFDREMVYALLFESLNPRAGSG